MARMLVSLVALALLVTVSPRLSAAQSKPEARVQAAAAASSAGKPLLMVNLNTASSAELEQLPGVGAKTAALIVEYRQKKGPFKKIEELMNVKGIGEKSFLKLKPQITVAAKAE